MFPAPFAVKNNLPVMLVNTSANDKIEFTDVKVLLSILLVLLFRWDVSTINKPMILHNVHVNFFASTLLALYLFITHPCFLFISHQVVWKPFKFINNVPQTNEGLVNESNFPSFLSLCVFILGHRLRKCPNNFCINISINVY